MRYGWPGAAAGRRIQPATGRRRASGGFSLIEVLVAFAVLAVALTLLLGTLSGATGQVRNAADASRAALHARSLLAQTGVGEVLQPGQQQGGFEEGRYRWQLDITPYTDPAAPPQAAMTPGPTGARLLHLRLSVDWGDGAPAQRLQIDSLRLVQADNAGSAW